MGSPYWSGYARGLDVLGATPVRPKIVARPRAGFVLKPTPGGNLHTSLVAMKAAPGDHKTTILNAKDVGERAVRIGNSLNAALKKSAAQMKVTRVHGAPAGKLPAHKRMTPAQMKKLADSTIKAGNALLKHAGTFSKKVTAVNAKVSAGALATAKKLRMGLSRGVPASARMRALAAAPASAHARAPIATRAVSRAATTLRGLDPEAVMSILGAYIERLDESFGDPDPTDPADAPATPPETDDPAAADPDTASTPATTIDPSISGPTAVDPSSGATINTYGVGPPPPMSAGSLAPTDYTTDPYGPSGSGDFKDPNWYNSTNTDTSKFMPMPVNPVWFDGSTPVGQDDLISYSWAFLNPGAVGGNLSGFHTDRNGVWNNFISSDNSWDDDHKLTSAETSDMYASSTAHNYGPLMGNPNNGSHGGAAHPDIFKGLRYDLGTNRWFWYYDAAPSKIKALGDQVRYNQAVTDWKTKITAAQTDATNAAIADQLNATTAASTATTNAASDAATQTQIDQQQTAAQTAADTAQAAAQQAADARAASDQTAQDQAQQQQEAKDAAYAQQALQAQKTQAAQDAADLAAAQQMDAAASQAPQRAPVQSQDSAPGDDDADLPPDSDQPAPDDDGMDDPSASDGGADDMNLDDDVVGTLRGTARLKHLIRARR